MAKLRSELQRERKQLADLRRARCEIVETVKTAHSESVSYFSIAAALVPARGGLVETVEARQRMANALRQRVFEARRRVR